VFAKLLEIHLSATRLSGKFDFGRWDAPRACDHVSRGWHPFWLLSPPVAPKLIKATRTDAKSKPQLQSLRNTKMQSKYASHVDQEREREW